MENYPGNSRKAQAEPKPPQKKVERVVEGKVVQRKKPLRRRFVETFIGGDDAGSVWGYIVNDVLVPAAKDMVSDAISQGIERTLFGEARHRSRSRGGTSGHISYNRFSSSPLNRAEMPRRELSHRDRATHNFREIVLETRREGEEVLDQMFTILDQYEAVTVSDLYDMTGLEKSFVDGKWGWVDLRGSEVVRVKGGYLLSLPPTQYLD